MNRGVGRPEHIEDIFESTLHLEDSQLQQGFEDGFQDGVEAGKIEGREVGLKLGFKQGEELGFYKGCIDIWKSVISKDLKALSARSQRSIQLLDEQVKAYPLSNHGDESLQNMLEMIRARFRAILAMLSIHIEYDGYPKDNAEDGISSF